MPELKMQHWLMEELGIPLIIGIPLGWLMIGLIWFIFWLFGGS